MKGELLTTGDQVGTTEAERAALAAEFTEGPTSGDAPLPGVAAMAASVEDATWFDRQIGYPFGD